MDPKMKRVDDAAQDRLLDLALQLMDAARAVVTDTFGPMVDDPLTATSVATQMAIQAVCAAEPASNRKRGEDEWSGVEHREMLSRFHGVGAGVGQAIGAFAPAGPLAQLEGLHAVNQGIESALEKRSAMTVERWKQSKGGRNGPQT